MASILRPTKPCPVPEDAERIIHKGKPSVKIRDADNRLAIYPLTRCGTKYLKPSRRWYVQFRDEQGVVRRVPASPDKATAQQLARDLERRVERIRLGLHDPAEDATLKPLTEHLDDFRQHLISKGNTPAHVELSVSRIRRLCEGCRFVYPPDIDASKITAWLNDLRRDDTPAIDMSQLPEQMTPSEAAKVLGVSLTAFGGWVRRLEISGSIAGRGKTRRVPRAVVEAIARQRAKGASSQTAAHYVTVMKGFCRWLVRNRRLIRNPVETLAAPRSNGVERHRRIDFRPEELRLLIETTRNSTRTFRGLDGPSRAMLYTLAVGSGLRVSGLGALTPKDFDLGAPIPCVRLPARFSKNRKAMVQPLNAELVAVLRPFLEGKPADTLVWPGDWATGGKAAEMLRADLAKAGIPYRIATPEGEAYRDFHSLRHSYLTMLGRSGADLRTAQLLAGHAEPGTTARYSHRNLNDLAEAVSRLPHFTAAHPEADETPGARPTSTPSLALENKDLRSVRDVLGDVLGDAQTPCNALPESAQDCTTGPVGPELPPSPQPLDDSQDSSDLHSVAEPSLNTPDRIRTYNLRFRSPATSRGGWAGFAAVCGTGDRSQVASPKASTQAVVHDTMLNIKKPKVRAIRHPKEIDMRKPP
jgi:site-specific recombinase XerC